MAMDEMKRQLFEQERWFTACRPERSGLYAKQSLQAVEMDGKDDYTMLSGI